MTDPIRIVGSFLSPYVRKVLACLEWKGLTYAVDPIVPFFGDERFTALSPLRRVPVMIEGPLALADSSVICQYLEDRYPERPLYPADVADRARARWLEEYADTRLGDVFVWRLFNERVIGRFVWNRPTDEEKVARTLAEDVPEILGWLEERAPRAGFLFGALSIADVSIASFFRNAAFAGVVVDSGRSPRLADWLARVLALECFARLEPYEKVSLRTPIARHREALAAAGASLTVDTFFTATPRKGLMSV